MQLKKPRGGLRDLGSLYALHGLLIGVLSVSCIIQLSMPIVRGLASWPKRIPQPFFRSHYDPRETFTPYMPMWTPVLEDQLLAYSAHWDVRPLHGMDVPYIRILALALNASLVPHLHGEEELNLAITCQFYFNNGTTTQARAVVYRHSENPWSEGGLFMLCPAAPQMGHHDMDEIPQSVSLLCSGCEVQWTYKIWGADQLPNLLSGGAENNDDIHVSEKGKLAICVRPTFGPMDEPQRLIQFLTYYAAAGVEHFTFYNAPGFAPRMLNILHKAQEAGLSIEVLPWNMFFSRNGPRHVHEYGQYMAINACLYWQMAHFEHTMVVDMDEYISSRGPVTSLPQLLDTFNQKHPQAAGFLFHGNLFYGSDRLNTSSAVPMGRVVELPFDMFHVFGRHGPYPTYNKSKYICKTNKTISGAIHYIGETVPGYEEVAIPDEEAAVFHYRAAAPTHAVVRVAYDGVPDFEMMKYHDILLQEPVLSRLLKIGIQG